MHQTHSGHVLNVRCEKLPIHFYKWIPLRENFGFLEICSCIVRWASCSLFFQAGIDIGKYPTVSFFRRHTAVYVFPRRFTGWYPGICHIRVCNNTLHISQFWWVITIGLDICSEFAMVFLTTLELLPQVHIFSIIKSFKYSVPAMLLTRARFCVCQYCSEKFTVTRFFN